MIENDKITTWLAAFGLDIHDATLFYEMMLSAVDDNVVPIDTFVQGCMRMKGEATSIDMQALIYQVSTISKRQTLFQESLMAQVAALISSSAHGGHPEGPLCSP